MAKTQLQPSQINNPVPLSPYPWVTPTLGTGWTTFDTGAIPTALVPDSWRYPRYHKDAMGYVHMDGLTVNNSGGTNTTSTNTVIFTLPTGFRPGHSLLLIGMANDSWCRIDIKVDGTVRIGTSVPNGTWLSLSPITFLAEQ